MAAEATSFEPALRAYLRLRRAQGFSSHVFTRSGLRRFFQHLARQRIHDLREVTEAHVVGFLRYLLRRKGRRGERISPFTVSGYLTLVRVFFAHLVERGVILDNPARGVPLPTGSKLPSGVLSLEHARKLMEAASGIPFLRQRNRAILELFYATGLRLSECARLDVSDVDLAMAQVVIRSGKGRKDRVVPLYGRAAAALAEYLRQVRPQLLARPGEEALFVSESGHRLSTDGYQRLMENQGRAAGIRTPLHPHALRHTCATHLLRGGADIRHVQLLLGHRSVRTTQRYTRVAVKDLREVLARCHPSERRRPRMERARR